MDIHNIVLLGEAGSGKTEIAANIALVPGQGFFILTREKTGKYGRKPGVVGFPPGAYGGQHPVKGRRGPVCI